jgi:N-methylhydantoinase A
MTEPSEAALRAGVDVGGTFTDVVVTGTGGRPRAIKVPTTPSDQSEAVAGGIAHACSSPPDLVAHGTTTATNAVLERRVARTVLVTTRGFADVLHIARQNRPSLYDLSVTRPEPLVPGELVVTVDERVAADGAVVVPLTDAEVARATDAVMALRPEAVAISLLFAYAAPAHEQRLAAALAGRLGDDVPITVSHRLLPEFREYERASTCTLNAAVAPVMRRYLARLADRLPDSAVTVMTSGGGTAALAFVADAPVHTLLSGPAGGVVAASRIAAGAGFPDAIAFDMGGTSTDVCLIRDHRPQVSASSTIADLPFRTPAVDIHTVGAGGGSIAGLDTGGALRVGPRSAGARPGPACYGLGGTEATVTDAHCRLGHLDVGRALGTDGAVRLDPDAATRALDDLARRLGLDGPDAAARGILTVVRATMARALRRVSTERGVDPRGLALVAYGGAGPLHASALAAEIGAAAVVVPPAPGVLSALGLLLAPPRHEASRTVMVRLQPSSGGSNGRAAALAAVWEELTAAGLAELGRQGASGLRVQRLADCRYAGQSHELRVTPAEGAEGLADALHAAHRTAYGYALPDEPIEVVTLRVVVEGEPALPDPPTTWDQGEAGPDRRRRVGLADGTAEVAVIDRAGLAPGSMLSGPLLVEQPDSTTLLERGDDATVDPAGNLVIRRRT